ncbi:MAG: VCBS repeat-containing protein [Chryseobacterium sp.]|nr:MAG: VCBS repeat-containing protein [Chryseobacterium sp.]
MNTKAKICLLGISACLTILSCQKEPVLEKDLLHKKQSSAADGLNLLAEPNRYLMLCESNGVIRIVNVTNDPTNDHWTWDVDNAGSGVATADKPYFRGITDAKRVLDGRYILATFNSGPSGAADSERGGVALIRYPAGNVVFYSRCGYQPHSAEILPDGNIVVAASATGGGLRVFQMDSVNRPSTAYKSSFYPLTSAHGVVWDKKRQKLYAAGIDQVYTYDYDFNINSPTLDQLATTSFGYANRNAHDFFPVYGEDRIWLSGNALFKMNIASISSPALFDNKQNIKSVSSGPSGFPIALQIATAGGSYSDKIVEAVSHDIIFQRTGLNIYKARWHFAAGTPYSYRNTDSKPNDFNNDGKSELSLFNPSGSPTKWKVWGDVAYRQTYGSGSQIPVPGDYNGDGRTDEAVWDPSDFGWHITTIADVTYGATGDIPVPADYDGDGKTDIALWRPGNGNWYIYGQSGPNYGLPNDIPAPADFTGDGNADAAVFRQGSGSTMNIFYVKYNSNIIFADNNPSIPVPGDYNGDGKSDIALYNRSTGVWTIKSLTTYTATVAAGAIVGYNANDIPCSGDFLELGKSLPAVYRPSTGTLYIYNAGTVTTQVLSGASGFKLLNLPYSIRKFFFP